MEGHEVRLRIESIGIIPAIRVSSAQDARFATAIHCAGISVAEITATIPDAVGVVSDLRRNIPEMLVEAGTLLDAQMAQRCLDAGAQLLTSPVLIGRGVRQKEGSYGASGGLDSERDHHGVEDRRGPNLSVSLRAQVGGGSYIRARKASFPHLPLIASGGVNLQPAFDFIRAGATALGIGAELIPKESIQLRQESHS